MRLIDADALIEELPYKTMSMWLGSSAECRAYNKGCTETEIAIANAPTVDPVKHGRWRKDTDPADGDLRCTNCGIAWPQFITKQLIIPALGYTDLSKIFKYCPWCGCKMDGDGKP